ncbi:hypothetical protein AHMF7605_16305 [Adhaeribacter arboris]|uniref:Uncharacterized protein n=1 Tax=Adhaeribacter arboris TaxID=2072846 RepID=A0A2T2YHG7_9BACT|nr:hypothetical protein [Adhaeribacter arboris]PSR54955.1 hypothetical protein AHMF7605_16305 [Adhaeribacter arboris]
MIEDSKAHSLDTIEDVETKLKRFESSDFIYQEDLTKELDLLDGDFDERIISKIVLWKVNRAPLLDNKTIDLLNKIKKDDKQIDEDLTKEILTRLLDKKNRGFDLPMASTLLRFKNPSIYQIIDQRAYRILKKNQILRIPYSIEKKINLYLAYLADLRALTDKYNLKFEWLDRTLYKMDKEINKNIKLKNYGK